VPGRYRPSRPKAFLRVAGRYNSTAAFSNAAGGQGLDGRMPSGLDYAAVVLDSSEAKRDARAGNMAPQIQLNDDELNRRSGQEWYRTYDEAFSIRCGPWLIRTGRLSGFYADRRLGQEVTQHSLGGWVQISHDLFCIRSMPVTIGTAAVRKPAFQRLCRAESGLLQPAGLLGRQAAILVREKGALSQTSRARR